jgi:hypothetical protein
MKTTGDKVYKLFNKSVSVLAKHYGFISKGINQENLHAVFVDDKNYHFAIKVVLNTDNNQIETYVAIANPYANQSVNDFKSIKELKIIIDNTLRTRRVMEDKLKHDQWKEVTDKLLDWEE